MNWISACLISHKRDHSYLSLIICMKRNMKASTMNSCGHFLFILTIYPMSCHMRGVGLSPTLQFPLSPQCFDSLLTQYCSLCSFRIDPQVLGGTEFRHFKAKKKKITVCCCFKISFPWISRSQPKTKGTQKFVDLVSFRNMNEVFAEGDPDTHTYNYYIALLATVTRKLTGSWPWFYAVGRVSCPKSYDWRNTHKYKYLIIFKGG